MCAFLTQKLEILMSHTKNPRFGITLSGLVGLHCDKRLLCALKLLTVPRRVILETHLWENLAQDFDHDKSMSCMDKSVIFAYTLDSLECNIWCVL